MPLSLKTKHLILGVGSFLPGYSRLPMLKKAVPESTGGTDSARYCYAVWLRHLVKAYQSGLPTDPGTIAELGPGDSIGIGLAALLSGAKSYYAFDIVNYTHHARNRHVFHELVELFRNREDIPDEKEFPAVRPVLESYGFPRNVLSESRLQDCLRQERVDSIREELEGRHPSMHRFISYIAPWDCKTVIKSDSIDMVYSQAVLEHVSDLKGTYQSLFKWLRPGGVMSHQIDLKSHGCAEEWNGHWTYSDFRWRLMLGSRPWLINRVPLSGHIELLRRNGFDVVYQQRAPAPGCGIHRSRLAARFRNIPDQDLNTSGAFIQAIKNRRP